MGTAFVQKLGSKTVTKLQDFFYAAGFLFVVLRETLFFIRKKRAGSRALPMQILFTGVDALSIVALLAMAIGVVIIIQGITIFTQFGQSELSYKILITVITRELGPILTAFIIIARSGTAIATEIGNMVISHEIEAYISVGVNPISYIVVPRFLGVTISMLVLTIYFNIFGLIGSFFISQFISPVPFVEYFENLLTFITPADIISSLVKGLIFGIIISVVATYNGFKVERSSTEIPQVVIKAVGQGFVFCILVNAVITIIYYI